MKGYKLIFISQINRDGSGTTKVSSDYRKLLQNDEFTIRRLSISQETYIAMGFNSFVVKVKKRYQNK